MMYLSTHSISTVSTEETEGQEKAKEEIILDENELAKGQEYTVVSDMEVSPDHRYLAFAVDHTGYETYTIFVKDLQVSLILCQGLGSKDLILLYLYTVGILCNVECCIRKL
mgnify:CR=1 FL=1